MNADDRVVGSALANTDNLEADEVWSFEVPMPAEDAVRVRLEKLRWRDEIRARDYVFGPYGTRDLYAK